MKHRTKVVLVSSAISAEALLRGRARRIAHVEERLKRLYDLRDELRFRVRYALNRQNLLKLDLDDLVVKIEADRRPHLRRCRTVCDSQGNVRILQPGQATRLTVKRKVA